MKSRFVSQSNAAFTLLEVVVVLVTVTVLFLLITSMTGVRKRSPRTQCTSNLKLIALSYNLWSFNHQNRLPMELPNSEGGTRQAALAGDLVANILAMSNELRTPTVLVCPADKYRKPAKTFGTVTIFNVSYFLNASASTTNLNSQNDLISGDRNIAIAGSQATPGFLQITNASDIQWAKWLHDGGGNVAFVDGSVHQLTTKGLRELLTLGGTTNRLIIP